MADSRTIRTTIELSGEGSYKNKLKEIGSGLKNVASAQKVLDAEYSKGDKSLAALTARQGLYQDKLALQKQKLETIRQEYEQVVAAEGKNSESARKLANEYNNASAQVIRTEKDLKGIEEAMEDASKAAEEVGEAAEEAAQDVKGLGTSSSQASQNMEKITQAAKDQEAALKKIGDQAQATATKLSKALATATAAAVTVGVKSFMEFENEMANVQTLADTTVKSMDQLSEEALQASNAVNISAETIAKSAYDALSSGIDTANVFDYMTNAGKAAKAGQAELNDVVNGSTSIMNAWKIASSQSVGVFEKMLVAQDKGKTTLGQISQNIGQITGLAPQLNISLEETLAATAALTKNGVQTSSAINGLKAVMSNVLKPTAEAAEEAARLGLQFNAAALRSKGLTGFLKDVMDKTGGSSESLAKLFGSVEGLSQIMLLGGTAAVDYQDALDAMAQSSGKLDAAFSTVTSSRAEKLSSSMNKLKNNAIEFGRSLAPYIDIAADALDNLSVKISGLSDEQMRSLLETSLWISGALAMAGAIGKVTNAVKIMSAAFGAGGGWAVLGIAGIAGLVAGLEALQSKLPSVEKSLANLFGNTDQSLIDQFNVAFNAQVNTTVSVDDYQAKIDAAVENIRNALKEIETISVTDKADIIAAIAEGSGLDLLDNVLDDYGISEEKIATVTASFATAMEQISASLEGLGLSEEAKNSITEVAAAGGDVQAALESCGVPEDKAAQIAGTITAAMTNVDAAMAGLGIDAETKTQLLAGMASNRSLIYAAMISMGVPENVAADVLASYTTLEGSLTGQIAGLYEQISKALTDGKADSPEVVSELEKNVRELYGGAINQVETWVNDEISKLDVNSATYDADVENIKTKGATMVTELQNQQTATLNFINETAGMSTAAVNARLGELQQIEEAVRQTIAELDYAAQLTGGAGAQASRITKGGAATNIETVGRAFGYEKGNRDTSLAALDEQYQADLLALEARYDELGKAEYEKQASALKSQYDANKAGVLSAYQQSIMELLQGLGGTLAQMNPEMAAKLKEAVQKMNLAEAVQENLANLDGITPVTTSDISDATYQAIVDSMGWKNMSKEKLVERMNAEITAKGSLADWKDSVWAAIKTELLGSDTMAAINSADLGFIDEALTGAIQNGVFDGIDNVDMTENTAKLKALFGGLGGDGVAGLTEGLAAGEDAARTGGSNLGDATIGGARSSLQTNSPSKVMHKIGQDAGQGLANGLNSKYAAVYAAAKRLAQAAESGARITLDIHSPSRKFFNLGALSGDGMIGGVQSKTKAVQDAMRQMVNPEGISPAAYVSSHGSGGSQSVNSRSTNVTVQYSGAFSRNEARKFGRALCDEMAAEAAARGG